jgi:hypothetical protein
MTLKEKAERLDKKGRKVGGRVNSSRPRKLSDKQALRMYEAWKNGTYFKSLFLSYGISEASFWNYIRRVRQGIIS